LSVVLGKNVVDLTVLIVLVVCLEIRGFDARGTIGDGRAAGGEVLDLKFSQRSPVRHRLRVNALFSSQRSSS
jgi:hypothetical protein